MSHHVPGCAHAGVATFPVAGTDAVGRILKARMKPDDFATLQIFEASGDGAWCIFVAAKRRLEATIAHGILLEHYPTVRRDGILVTVGMA
jgi:hypothetical protein